MPNRFERGQARLVERFIEHAQVTIVYHRGLNSVTLSVWPGNTVFKILDRDNQRLEWGDRDYLIPSASLVIGGVPLVPQKDDWIEEAFPEGVVQFNVSAPENEPVWRYSDVQRTLYRVHAKRVTS